MPKFYPHFLLKIIQITFACKLIIALAHNNAILICMAMLYRYHSLYWTYAGMKARCYNRRHPRYPEWGGRGIKVCDRWLERSTGFANFVADMGERPTRTSIDRINNDGDYTPENCRWATPSQQSFNRRIKSTNTSGVTGVCWSVRQKQWQASITINKRRQHLGWFDDFETAVSVRKDAEMRLINATSS
jgi:hypothetical protein